jgi:hypothetical protein
LWQRELVFWLKLPDQRTLPPNKSAASEAGEQGGAGTTPSKRADYLQSEEMNPFLSHYFKRCHFPLDFSRISDFSKGTGIIKN